MPLFGWKKKYPQVPGELIRDAINEFLLAPTWEEKKQLMIRHRGVLLEPDPYIVDETFIEVGNKYVKRPDDDEIIGLFFVLLNDCRKKGIEETFSYWEPILERYDYQNLRS